MLVKALLSLMTEKERKKTLLAWIKEEKIVTDSVDGKQKYKDGTKSNMKTIKMLINITKKLILDMVRNQK